MDTFFAVVFVAIVAWVGGFAVSYDVSKTDVVTDCQKLGKFRYKDTVYECKEEKK